MTTTERRLCNYEGCTTELAPRTGRGRPAKYCDEHKGAAKKAQDAARWLKDHASCCADAIAAGSVFEKGHARKAKGRLRTCGQHKVARSMAKRKSSLKLKGDTDASHTMSDMVQTFGKGKSGVVNQAKVGSNSRDVGMWEGCSFCGRPDNGHCHSIAEYRQEARERRVAARADLVVRHPRLRPVRMSQGRITSMVRQCEHGNLPSKCCGQLAIKDKHKKVTLYKGAAGAEPHLCCVCGQTPCMYTYSALREPSPCEHGEAVPIKCSQCRAAKLAELSKLTEPTTDGAADNYRYAETDNEALLPDWSALPKDSEMLSGYDNEDDNQIEVDLP